MGTDNKYWYLRNHKLFRTLSNHQIEDLCIISKYKTAKKGEIIYFAEEVDPRIYLLKRGKIKILAHDTNGNETIKDIMQAGDLFGEITLMEGSTLKESAVAHSTEVAICSFKIVDFEKLIQEDPELAISYFKWLGFRIKRIENRYTNLVFKDVKDRLWTLFTDLAINEGVKNEENRYVLPNYLTHQDIAGLICCTRQTVTQLIGELEKEGNLSYSRKEITINLSK